jgi:hypothetical protein
MKSLLAPTIKHTNPVFFFEDSEMGCFYDIKTEDGRWVGCGSAPSKLQAIDAANEMWWEYLEQNEQ